MPKFDKEAIEEAGSQSRRAEKKQIRVPNTVPVDIAIDIYGQGFGHAMAVAFLYNGKEFENFNKEDMMKIYTETFNRRKYHDVKQSLSTIYSTIDRCIFAIPPYVKLPLYRDIMLKLAVIFLAGARYCVKKIMIFNLRNGVK